MIGPRVIHSAEQRVRVLELTAAARVRRGNTIRPGRRVVGDRSRSHHVVLPSGKLAHVGTGERAHEWAYVLRDEIGQRGGLEVNFTFELKPHEIALLKTLGVTPVYRHQRP